MIAGLVKGISSEIDVHEFWDSDEALEWCIAHGPTLVLLDYRMPSIDGVTFAQRLKAAPTGERTAIVMVTSQDDASIRQAALEAGVVAYVRKPVSAAELKLQIRNLLVSMHGQWVAGATTDDFAAHSRSQLGALSELLRLARKSHPWMQYDLVSPQALATTMAKQLEFSESLVDLVSRAGEMYSIGLLGVPVDVLQQSSPLSLADHEAIQAADGHSYAILDPVDPEVAAVLRSCHENFNGGGYPLGLAGGAIPLVSRLLSVAASFAALTSNRPHRPASSVSEAIAQIQRQSGVRYDPRCVNALVDALPALVPVHALPPRSEGVAVAGSGVR